MSKQVRLERAKRVRELLKELTTPAKTKVVLLALELIALDAEAAPAIIVAVEKRSAERAESFRARLVRFPIPTEAPPGARLVPLTKGAFTIVDEEDFAEVSRYHWKLLHSASHTHPTAERAFREPGNSKRYAISLHRELMKAGPLQLVDHKNGNTLDNRRCNLRITDASGNARNIVFSRRQKRGGRKGVSWNKRARSWNARIHVRVPGEAKARSISLGFFPTEDEAARAYDAGAREYFGEFAACNFPEEQ